MKNVRLIREDESAVSPVIATILMVAITVVLAAVLYVMVSGLLTGPGNAPQLIGMSRSDTSANWVLRVDSLPAQHALTTTTFLMLWQVNSSIVNPPGQATLNALKTASGGVQYLPVVSSAINLEVSALITISKTTYPNAGNQITIQDGSNVLWTGTI